MALYLSKPFLPSKWSLLLLLLHFFTPLKTNACKKQFMKTVLDIKKLITIWLKKITYTVQYISIDVQCKNLSPVAIPVENHCERCHQSDVRHQQKSISIMTTQDIRIFWDCESFCVPCRYGFLLDRLTALLKVWSSRLGNFWDMHQKNKASQMGNYRKVGVTMLHV